MLAQRIRFAIAGGTVRGQRGRFDRALDTRLVQQMAIGAIALRLGCGAGRTRGNRAIKALRGAAHVIEIAIGG